MVLLLREGEADRERGQVEPLLQRLGLSQGEKLGAQAQRAYRNLVREGLLARASASLEDAIRGARSRQGLEMALKAYISLHDEKARDLTALEPALYGLWQVPEARRPELSRHLRAGLAEKQIEIPRAFDAQLVRDARQRLAAAKFT